MKLVHTQYPYKGPIDQPCSACSAGDTAMEYHDHDYVKPEHRRGAPLSPSYTLPQLSALAREYVEAARERWGEQDVVEVELQLSLFLAWIQTQHKRGNDAPKEDDDCGIQGSL